jgi:exosome complex RNA-binding protein Csl4
MALASRCPPVGLPLKPTSYPQSVDNLLLKAKVVLGRVSKEEQTDAENMMPKIENEFEPLDLISRKIISLTGSFADELTIFFLPFPHHFKSWNRIKSNISQSRKQEY